MFTVESQRSPKKHKWKDTIRGLPRQFSFDFKDSNLPFSADSSKLDNVDILPDTLKYTKNKHRLYKTLAERRPPREGLQLDFYNSVRRQAIQTSGAVSLKESLPDENSIDV